MCCNNLLLRAVVLARLLLRLLAHINIQRLLVTQALCQLLAQLIQVLLHRLTQLCISGIQLHTGAFTIDTDAEFNYAKLGWVKPDLRTLDLLTQLQVNFVR